MLINGDIPDIDCAKKPSRRFVDVLLFTDSMHPQCNLIFAVLNFNFGHGYIGNIKLSYSTRTLTL